MTGEGDHAGRRRGVRRICALLLVLLLPAAAPVTGPGFTNPILASGPDPWIARDGRTYYLMVTRGDRLAIRKTTDIARVSAAPEVTVWTPPRVGRNALSIWAPELHRIGGKWFIYYTAAPSGWDDNLHRGIFVLEHPGPDPTVGRWIDRGRVDTRFSAIDATVFTHRNRLYFVYALQLGAESRLAIAPMRKPWTLAAREVVISRPTLPWERHIYPINEAPQFLRGPRGDLFLTFSASACTSDDYAIGLLSAPAGSDPLDPRAWRKAPSPVVAKDPGPGVGVFGPGHNGFFTAPDGTHWMVFHANPGPSMGCTSNRGTWIQPFSFGPDGRPVFHSPTGPRKRLAAPGQAGDPR